MNFKSYAYNARNLSLQEVAENFVVPAQFEEILQFKNHILVGPRGIGKTTILKVLTATGLFYLAQRQEISELNINYIPVYIPAETLWKGNAASIKSSIPDLALRDKIQNGLFVDHCLRELLSSIEDSMAIAQKFSEINKPIWALDISKEQEEKISRECSSLWELDKIQTSFIGLKLALIKRMNVYASAVTALNSAQSPANLDGAANLDLLMILKGFFDIIDNILGPKRWSINFDEMEIAPNRVLYKLYSNLRSFDQRAVLKFSLFPYIDFLEMAGASREKSHLEPQDGQDFTSVILAGKFSNQDFSFAEKIVVKQCEKQNVEFYDFLNYLNSSKATQGVRRYKGNDFTRDYESLFSQIRDQKIDPAFIMHLQNKGVASLEKINELQENKKAELIRKVAPIAEIRFFYQKNYKQKRSSKGFGYYHGYNQILYLTEGNPRALITYMNELLRGYKNREASTTVQNAVISQNVDRFRSMVATQAVPVSGSQINALNIVDQMGQHLSDLLFDEKFPAHPHLSYELKGLDENTKKLLGIAINTGALVVDHKEQGQSLVFDIEGCRVRISYRMAPFYPLPTITGSSKVINSIPSSTSIQGELLNWRPNND